MRHPGPAAQDDGRSLMPTEAETTQERGFGPFVTFVVRKHPRRSDRTLGISLAPQALLRRPAARLHVVGAARS